jgi:hypothetical protein
MNGTYPATDNHIFKDKIKGRVDIIDKKSKITFRYHNPNTDDEAQKYITKILIEASKVKFENILQDNAIHTNINQNKEKSSV